MVDAWRKIGISFLLLSLGLLGACRAHDAARNPSDLSAEQLSRGVQALGLDGRERLAPPLEAKEQALREAALAAAQAEWAAHPASPEAWLWKGRRLAYLGRFPEAIECFSQGHAKFPLDPRFLRHRGHRWITLRQFARARGDLERAVLLARGLPDEVEPAGLSNAGGVELSTRDQEIHYHLALSRYLQGDFEAALPAWQTCRQLSGNPDSVCSSTTWLVATLLRLGREQEAREALFAITPDMGVVEYRAYHQLLLALKGELDPEVVLGEARSKGVDSVDFATTGYGIANAYFCRNQPERARAIWSELASSANWHAFGVIGAEVELAR